MRADRMAMAQNTASLAIQHYNARRFAALGELLAEQVEVEFVYTKRTAQGRAAALELLRAHEAALRAAGWEDWYFLHSPALALDPNCVGARFCAEAHTYYFGAEQTMLGCTRFDVRLRLCGGKWQIVWLRAYDLESFLPTPGGAVRTATQVPVPENSWAVSGADCVALENLLGRFCRAAHSDAMIWAEDATLYLPGLMAAPALAISAQELLAQIESENGNFFLSIPLYSAPVLRVEEDGNTGEGVWLLQHYRLEGRAFGKTPVQIVQELGYAYAQFCRTPDGWKIRALRYETAWILPEEPFPYETFGQVDLAKGGVWRMPDEGPNAAEQFPADVFAIRALLPEWTMRARRGENTAFADLYFTQDPVLEIRRPLTGAALAEKLQEFVDAFTPNKVPSAHNASSPYVTISPDGTRAAAYYVDQSWTNFGGQEGDGPEALHDHMRLVALYRMDLRRESGEWMVKRLEWYPMYAICNRQMRKSESRGWSGAPGDAPWPLAFETIQTGVLLHF